MGVGENPTAISSIKVPTKSFLQEIIHTANTWNLNKPENECAAPAANEALLWAKTRLRGSISLDDHVHDLARCKS